VRGQFAQDGSCKRRRKAALPMGLGPVIAAIASLGGALIGFATKALF
jgi:hypothetical protein